MSAGRPGRLLLVVATVVVVLALGAGLWTIGAPGVQRDMKLDQRRENELSRLHQAVRDHWEEKGVLPASLRQLASRPGMRLAIVDPVSGEPYGYTVTGDGTFRLCATFATDTAGPLAVGRRGINHDFPHGIGLACFDRKARASRDDIARAIE